MVRPCVARRLLRVGDVRPCINVSGLCLEPFVPRAIMDISAPAISLAVRPQWAIWVTSVRMRREDRSSISFYPLADLGRQDVSTAGVEITRPESWLPRMLDHEPERSKRCERACWRARWRGRCDAAASSL